MRSPEEPVQRSSLRYVNASIAPGAIFGASAAEMNGRS
jgi:hypothetical protein